MIGRRVWTLWLSGLVWLSVGFAAEGADFVWQGTDDVDAPTRATTVEPAAGGGLTLVRRHLFADEIGRTVNAHVKNAVNEYVAGALWVKKEFVLDDPAAEGAILSICASERTSNDPQELIVTLNGTPLAYKAVRARVRPYSGVYDEKPAGGTRKGQRFTSYWQGGWQRVPVPVNLLRKGTNTVVMRAKAGHRWRFMIEESLFPNRSARSLDAGRTWDYDHLSNSGTLNGEYLVRLLLIRHPPSGWVESPVIDLWQAGTKGGIGRPVRVGALTISAETDAPEGTTVALLGRLGPTPTYDPATWTAWAPAADLAQGKAHGRRLIEKGARFAQWRAVLATGNPLAAPVLKSVRLDVVSRPVPVKGGDCELVTLDQPPMVRTSVPFAHGQRGKRMKLLETRFHLDEIVADTDDELRRLTALARWVARKTTVGNHKPGTLLRDSADYDALLTLETAGKMLTHGMCVHEGAVFAQCATALGWPARRAIWSHAIAEVWLNTQRKWVTFDASSGRGYLFKDGRGAGMVEIANAWTPGADRTDHPIRWMTPKGRPKTPGREPEWFTRFWIPWRSNFLESPSPGEPGHGSQTFKFNGHFRYRHPGKEPFPWFDFYSRRVGDFNFTCNGTHIHLARGESDGGLEVVLEHDMPNFERFEIRTEEEAWTPTKAAFTWHLKPGRNRLQVRALNDWQAEAIDGGDAEKAAATLKRLVPIVSTAVVRYEEK